MPNLFSVSFSSFTAAVLLLGVCSCFNSAAADAKRQPSNVPTALKQTTVTNGDKKIPITIADLKDLAVSLHKQSEDNHWDKFVPPDLRPLLDANLKNNRSVWIDGAGYGHIGVWLLSDTTEKGSPVLTFRPLPPGTFRYVAHVNRVGKHWRIGWISFEDLHPR